MNLLIIVSYICTSSFHHDHTYVQKPPSLHTKVSEKTKATPVKEKELLPLQLSEKRVEIRHPMPVLHSFFYIFCATFSHLSHLQSFLYEYLQKGAPGTERYRTLALFNQVFEEFRQQGHRALSSYTAILADEAMRAKFASAEVNNRDEVSPMQYLQMFAQLIAEAEARMGRAGIDSTAIFRSTYRLWAISGHDRQCLRSTTFLQDVWGASPFSDFDNIFLDIFNLKRSDSGISSEIYADRERKIEMDTIPIYLVLNINRIQGDIKTHKWIKLDTLFEFPEQANMKTSELDHQTHPYNIKAMILKVGRGVDGRYESYVREGKEWWSIVYGDKIKVQENQVFKKLGPRSLFQHVFLVIYELEQNNNKLSGNEPATTVNLKRTRRERVKS